MTIPSVRISRDHPLAGGFAAIGSGVSGGIASSLWGVPDAPAVVTSGWRLIFGTTLLALIQVWRHQRPRPTKEELRIAFLPGIVFGLSMVSLAGAAQRTSILVIMVLGAAAPAFTAFAERMIFHRRLSLVAWLAILLAGFGAAGTIVGAPTNSGTAMGNFLAITEQTLGIVYILITARALKHIAIFRYIFAVAAVAVLTVGPFFLLSGSKTMEPHEYLAILGVSIMGGIIGWGSFMFAQRLISTGMATGLTLTSVPVGAISALIILDQDIRAAQIFGSAIVIAAILMLLRETRLDVAESQLT